MDRDERIMQLRAEIASRAPTLSHLPEGHPTREALLSECASFTVEIEELQKGAPASAGTRFVGILLAAGGIYLSITHSSAIPFWSGVVLAVLGVFVYIGA